jgi:hypothetical protein
VGRQETTSHGGKGQEARGSAQYWGSSSREGAKEEAMIRRAYYKVTYRSLRALLGLPENTNVITVVDKAEQGVILVIMEHPALPEVNEGVSLLLRSPTFRVIGPAKPEETEFEEWV